MNYESKYKEALSFLKDLKPYMSDYCIEKLEEFFPELKETEDGKIRKEIIEYITRYKDCITDKEYDSWIAWLEKQGEQKTSWSEEDENHVKSMLSTIECCKVQFPNSPAVVEAYNADAEWLKSIKDRVQLQLKQEWSAEDEANMYAVWKACGHIYGTQYQCILGDWLKSLKPNHWKPSEEQMRVLQIAIKDYGICHEKYVLESLYNNLKNL